MEPNHLSKAAVSSCSSMNGRDHCGSLIRSAPAGELLELESHNYERNFDPTIDNYAINVVISEAISDQGSSSAASSICDQNQVEIKSKSLNEGVFGSRKLKLEEGQGSGSYGEVLQEISMESDLTAYAEVGVKGVERSYHGEGDGAAAKLYYSSADRGCAEGVKATVCGRGYADTSGSRKARRSALGNTAGADNEAESVGTCRAHAAAGTMSRRRKKFVGVRQRRSGRWVAEIKDTTQKIRMWLGTYDTAEAAARAYDEAACLLRGSNTRTNFNLSTAPSSPSTSPVASRLAHMLRARQNRNIAAESASPASSPPAVSATTEPNHGNPLSFSSSHNNPLSSSVYPRKRMQSIIGSATYYPCATMKQTNTDPHISQVLHDDSLNPCRKTRRNHQHEHMQSNHSYVLQLLQAPATGAHKNPLERSASSSESKSSDSDPSTLTNHEQHHTHLHDHLRILPQNQDANSGSETAANGMPKYPSIEVSTELLRTHDLNSTNEEMDWDDHKQIFAQVKNLVSTEDIDTLAHDQHSMRASHNNYREGGFMDALMGINDDVILDPSEKIMATSYYSSHIVGAFDFSLEASLGSSMMQVDEFPLIHELLGKLEKAEGGGLQYVHLHDEEGGSHHSSSSSSNVVHADGDSDENVKLGLQLSGNLDGSLVCGINSDLEMKRMRFERIASASLYALNGVHEMVMKQNTPCHNNNPGINNFSAGNSASFSFNFLTTSPSYMLSSPWRPSPAASTNTAALSTTPPESLALNSSHVNETVINTPSLMPSSGTSSLSDCPSDTIASNKVSSTLSFSDMGSDTTANVATSHTSMNTNSSDAQSQLEAAMWNSWDLAPLCTLVA